jgi:UDP-glucose 4-epimerase
MNMLVTGGAGFIGSHVVDALIAEGHDVTVIDNLSSGKKENLNPQAHFFHLDIGDPRVEKLFQDNSFDIMFHLAAQIDVRKSVTDPVYDATINILDSVKLLNYCRQYNVSRVIYSSTGGAIYGEPEYLPADEKHPVRPLAPYGISKYSLEKYIEYFSDLYGLEYVILRYANVYGPRQDPHGEAGVVAIFSGLLLEGKQCKIFGNGEQTRDYVYAGDIVRANILSINRASGEILNLGTGVETSVNQLHSKMCEIMGVSSQPAYQPARPGEVDRISLDIRLAEKVLGWKPEVSIHEGLKDTIEYFRNLKTPVK